MIKHLGKGNLILSSLTQETLAKLPAHLKEGAQCSSKNVLDVNPNSSCILLLESLWPF
jgi:hypothetical protein